MLEQLRVGQSPTGKFAAGVFAAIAALLATVSPAVAQGQRWTLDVDQRGPIKLSLRATDAPLAEITADLAKRLKLPITVEPELRQLPVTADFERRELNDALPLLASRGRVFADYESGQEGSPAKPVAIFFLEDTSDAPPIPVGKNQSEVHVIAGNTEDGEAASRSAQSAPSRTPAPPLDVKVENDRLTVRARQQPLITIVYAVAGQLGASVSVGTQTPSLQELLMTPTDAALESADIETGVLSLSPAIHLYIRRDLRGGPTRVLRITLVEPAGRL